jgi:hypothetical protein
VSKNTNLGSSKDGSQVAMFFRNKSFIISLLFGVCVIFAVAIAFTAAADFVTNEGQRKEVKRGLEEIFFNEVRLLQSKQSVMNSKPFAISFHYAMGMIDGHTLEYDVINRLNAGSVPVERMLYYIDLVQTAMFEAEYRGSVFICKPEIMEYEKALEMLSEARKGDAGVADMPVWLTRAISSARSRNNDYAHEINRRIMSVVDGVPIDPIK